MVRRNRMASCVVFLAVGGAGACASFLDGTPVDPTNEAGTDARDAGNEAGTPDGAGPTDATVDGADATPADASEAGATALTCLQSDFHCSDFETTKGTFMGNDSTCSGCAIGVVSGTAHRGTKSLKVHLAAGDSPVMNRNVSAPAVPFFVRFYVHVPVKPTAILRIMTVTTTEGNGFEIGVTTGGNLTGITYSQPTTTKATSALVTGAGFHCVEWAVTNDTTTMYLDDVELTAGTLTRTSTDPITTLGVGAFYYNLPSAPATDVWYDDLVVSPTKVGCAR